MLPSWGPHPSWGRENYNYIHSFWFRMNQLLIYTNIQLKQYYLYYVLLVHVQVEQLEYFQALFDYFFEFFQFVFHYISICTFSFVENMISQKQITIEWNYKISLWFWCQHTIDIISAPQQPSIITIAFDNQSLILSSQMI